MNLAYGKVEAVFSSVPGFSAELVAGQQSLRKDRLNLQSRNHVLFKKVRINRMKHKFSTYILSADFITQIFLFLSHMTVNVWNSIFDNTDGILRITYRTGTIIMIKPVGILAQKSNNVNNFWLLYLDAIIGSDIPEKNEEWFV